MFKYLQDEIKRRALKDQAGPEFDEQIKNVANASMWASGIVVLYVGVDEVLKMPLAQDHEVVETLSLDGSYP